jgi:HAMP domain-containing protein
MSETQGQAPQKSSAPALPQDQTSPCCLHNFVERTKPRPDGPSFPGDLAAIPDKGSVLERFCEGNSIFVRGIFPIQEAAGNTVGAMFVVWDISAADLAMRHTQNVLVLLTVLPLALGTVLVLTLFNRLVFRRLQHIIPVATRIVGGDYAVEIRADSYEEVGQFARLFAQFRRVFVDLLSHIPVLQEKARDPSPVVPELVTR